MKKIRVGIVGVGNNASAIVQGVYHYTKNVSAEEIQPGYQGILFPKLCGYEIQDIEFSTAFDVDERKIGKDLGSAIFCLPNNYPRVFDEDLPTGATVRPAPVLDGVPNCLADTVAVSAESNNDTELNRFFDYCTSEVINSNTLVLLNFLPSGSDQATRFFAKVAAAAKAAFVNCTPSPVVHDDSIRQLFEEAKVPLLGDDLESHFGSSLIHRTLLTALEQRGLEIVHSYQVNLGGNTDFLNLSHRSDAKKKSKMKAISLSSNAERVNILPSGGFLPGLGDHKVAYFVIEGRGWLNMPVTLDVKLQVQDSSNAAGVIIDLIRIAQAGIDRGIAGNIPLSYYFKNPLAEKLSTEDALEAVYHFAHQEDK
ncbi:MAG: inositol-3-phosphate synthase [Brasilonema sp.]